MIPVISTDELPEVIDHFRQLPPDAVRKIGAAFQKFGKHVEASADATGDAFKAEIVAGVEQLNHMAEIVDQLGPRDEADG